MVMWWFKGALIAVGEQDELGPGVPLAVDICACHGEAGAPAGLALGGPGAVRERGPHGPAARVTQANPDGGHAPCQPLTQSLTGHRSTRAGAWCPRPAEPVEHPSLHEGDGRRRWVSGRRRRDTQTTSRWYHRQQAAPQTDALDVPRPKGRGPLRRVHRRPGRDVLSLRSAVDGRGDFQARRASPARDRTVVREMDGQPAEGQQPQGLGKVGS